MTSASLNDARSTPGGTLLQAALIVLWGCGEAEEGVSFQRDIKPLFDQRCAVCHFSGNGYADLENPFNPDRGLVGGSSVWYENHRYGPALNIKPGDPEQSFVLEKVTNPALRPEACDPGGVCLPGDAGFIMPPAPRRMKENQREAVRQWIREGADEGFFLDYVRPMFGNEASDPCRAAGSDPGCIGCVSCHREDGPYHPQGVDMIDLVGVPATFRPDLMIVEPGNPEESFLMLKLDAIQATSDVGAPMPYGYEPLSEQQVALLRQWIAEGARNN